MVMLNPRHPTVTAAGLSLKPAPAHPTTVISELSHLRRLARCAQADALPPDLAAWQDNDLPGFVTDLREQLSASSIGHYIGTLKMLHRYGPALTGNGLRSDPWAGKSAQEAAHTPQDAVLPTPAIPPEQWFALIRAAWTYVHTFAPDILRAHTRYQELVDTATTMTGNHDKRLDRWLADPANPVPIHRGTGGPDHDHGGVNWSVLTLMLGGKHLSAASVFARNRAASLHRIARVEEAVGQRTSHHDRHHRRPYPGSARRRDHGPLASRPRSSRNRTGTSHAA
jgi:hypothetical protein